MFALETWAEICYLSKLSLPSMFVLHLKHPFCLHKSPRKEFDRRRIKVYRTRNTINFVCETMITGMLAISISIMASGGRDTLNRTVVEKERKERSISGNIHLPVIMMDVANKVVKSHRSLYLHYFPIENEQKYSQYTL